MRKVGIITQFHNSINYGGVLQAYALCRAIREMGHPAEQIRFIPSAPEEYAVRKPLMYRVMNLFRPAILKDYLSSKAEEARNASIAAEIARRREGFLSFGREYIPQSGRAYPAEEIAQTAEAYDCFITGSDQVWNLNWYQGAYFLDFVPAGKPKLSYAASLGMRNLTEQQQEKLRQLLADFTAVSVREEDAVNLVQPAAEVPVECVLDPTMLLSAQQWDEVCSEKQIQEPYLFCYFLGDNSELRTMAEEYARRHGLKIVTIPHASGLYTKNDRFFGEEKVWDASPGDFLSLIRYADCVFTNSFHAAVFSGIFEKQYFVFPRHKGDRMVSRIYTLTGYFDCQDHFCDSDEKCTLDYIDNLPRIRYDGQSEVLIRRREQSMAFLARYLPERHIGE